MSAQPTEAQINAYMDQLRMQTQQMALQQVVESLAKICTKVSSSLVLFSLLGFFLLYV
jgi:hypothetical protein